MNILALLLALAFLGAGGSKLAGDAMHVANFDRWGYPSWFMYVTGLIEVVAALLILLPKTRFYGAALLVPTMIGAILTHIVGGDGLDTIIAPLVLLALVGFVAWTERSKVMA